MPDEHGSGLARPTWGPGALLADLELRAGRPARREDAIARLASQRELLAELDLGVFAESMRVDPWGTTRTLVALRDALVAGGWDGRPITSAGPRVAVVTRLPASPGGAAERLVAVTAALTEAPYATLTLAEPRRLWPCVWRTLFARLEAVGTIIDELPAPRPSASPESDLGKLQRLIADGTLPTSELRGDGSVVLLRDETAEPLAEAVAAELARLAPETRAAVLRGMDFAPLEVALAAHGLPRLGGVKASGMPSAAAWLPLVMRLAHTQTGTFDPEAAIDLTLLPGHGLGHHADRLAAAISEAPGLGSRAWSRVAPAAAKAHPEALARLVGWLTPATTNEAAELAGRLHALDALLRARTSHPLPREAVQVDADDALELARHTLGTVLRTLPSQGVVDAAPIDALLALLADRAAVATTRLEAGVLERADAPEALLAPVDVLMWWGFVEGAQPQRLFRPTEVRALAAAGVAIEDPNDVLRAQAQAARNAVLRTRERLVWVVPDRHAGERQNRHPLWAELLGRLGLEDDDAALLLERTPGDLARMRPELTVAVAPRLLPPTSVSWTVPKAALAAPAGQLPTLSVSNLERLLSCPLKQVLASHLQLRRRATGALQTGPLMLGRIGHAFVERLQLAGRLRSADRASVEEVLDQVFADEAAHLLRPGRAAARRHLTRVYLGCVAKLVELLDARGLDVTSTEEDARIAFAGGFVTLRTDLRARDSEGRMTVIDLKWSTRSHAKALDEDRAVQLAAYVHALSPASGAAGNGMYFGIMQGNVVEARSPEALAETWRRIAATLPALRALLADGVVPVSGLPTAVELGLVLGLEGRDAFFGDRAGACRYCDYAALCGRSWEALAQRGQA